MLTSSSFPVEAHDSPHGQQWQRGFGRLRFAQQLEEDFRRSSQRGLRHQSLLTLALATVASLMVIAVEASLLSAVPDDIWASEPAQLLMTVRALNLLGLVAAGTALWANRCAGRQRHLIAGVLFGTVVSHGTAMALLAQLGLAAESSGLLLTLLAVFLPLGLTFIESLAVALGSTAVVVLLGTLLLEGGSQQVHLRLVPAMLMGISVGAVGAYLREYGQREQFLLRRMLQWQASRDPLTGLFNRRLFDHHLGAAIRQSRRECRPLALLMLDVDHFKLYNDLYGHPAGDEALRLIGKIVQQTASRPLDMAARLGGEELALLLYDADAAHLPQLCRRLMQVLHDLNLQHGASPTSKRLTLSIGCAVLSPQDTATSLCMKADQRLYRAKQQGRNQAVWADPVTGLKLVS
jgi:diguanylate cyclase (GGDEF)-like protein